MNSYQSKMFLQLIILELLQSVFHIEGCFACTLVLKGIRLWLSIQGG